MFGPPGNSKGALLFFLVNIVLWGYPMYIIKVRICLIIHFNLLCRNNKTPSLNSLSFCFVLRKNILLNSFLILSYLCMIYTYSSCVNYKTYIVYFQADEVYLIKSVRKLIGCCKQD